MQRALSTVISFPHFKTGAIHPSDGALVVSAMEDFLHKYHIPYEMEAPHKPMKVIK